MDTSYMTKDELIEHLKWENAELRGEPVGNHPGYFGFLRELGLHTAEAKAMAALCAQRNRVIHNRGFCAVISTRNNEFPTETHVKVIIAGIRRKLKALGYPNPIRTIYGQGYTVSKEFWNIIDQAEQKGLPICPKPSGA